MINHKTEIDTVALQLDFNNAKEQRAKLSLLCQWITGRELGKLKADMNSSTQVIKYNLLYGRRKLLTVHSGATKIKSKFNGNMVTQYYIRIRFAGLKSYNKLFDVTSYNCLMTICGWLNTTRANYRFVELDVAIDVNCRFENMLIVCVNKSSRVLYHKVGDVQYYNGVPTSYIENYSNKDQLKNAVLRAYLYNKSAKEELDFAVIRFEMKLQNRFFLRNKFEIESIINAFDKYYVMYFENARDKFNKISEYNKYMIVTSREIYKLRFEDYRLYPNLDVVAEFIKQVQSVYVGFYGDIVIPPFSHNL